MYFSSFDPLNLSPDGKNIRIAWMNAGLGNQAFQYIFARWLELKTGEPCFINDFYFLRSVYSHNGYEMDRVFNLKPRLLSRHVTPEQKEEILWYHEKGVTVQDILRNMGYPISLIAETSDFSFKGNVSWTPANMYNVYLASTQGCTYFHGYWINVNWFKDIIGQMLKELDFIPLPDEKNKEYARQIEETNSVAVHFRHFGGDWQMNGSHIAKGVEALEKHREQNDTEEYTYFIFTYKPEELEKDLEDAGLKDKKIVVIEGNMEPNNYIDCQLMTLCKHRIVTNSSFGYLAALLRKHRDGLYVNLNPARQIV